MKWNEGDCRRGKNCREDILYLEDFEGKLVPHLTHLVIEANLSHSCHKLNNLSHNISLHHHLHRPGGDAGVRSSLTLLNEQLGDIDRQGPQLQACSSAHFCMAVVIGQASLA